MAYYVRYHLQSLKEAPDISKSLTEFLIPRWTPEAHSPMLNLAVSSKALAIFSQAQQYPPAAAEASMKYRRLLCITHDAVSHLEKDNVDACLLAIFLMSRYEDAMHQPFQHHVQSPFLSTLQSFSHHDGAFAVLKSWKDRLSYIQPATDIIRHTRRCAIKSAILRSLAIPHWMIEGTSFGEEGFDLEYDRIIVQLTNVRHRLSTLLNEQQNTQPLYERPNSVAEELSKDAQGAEEALQRWVTQFPSTWCYQRHTLQSADFSSRSDLYSPVVFSYSSPAYAAVWAKYYATRMLIISTSLTILEFLRPELDLVVGERRFEYQSKMGAVAKDLASSVPICLQRFIVKEKSEPCSPQDSITLNTYEEMEPYIASLMVWPLSLASSLRHVEVEQKWWFKSKLARIGRIVGVRMLECAKTDHWLEF